MLRFEEAVGDKEIKDIMCGSEAAELRHMLQCTYPVSNGIIQNWDDAIHLWDYTFDEVYTAARAPRRLRPLTLAAFPFLPPRSACTWTRATPRSCLPSRP